jgi:hypothetical protein
MQNIQSKNEKDYNRKDSMISSEMREKKTRRVFYKMSIEVTILS